MNRLADLHVHSNRSDGSDPPARVVERAAEAGLTAIALTDHDTTEGLAEAIEAGKRLGVEVIAGIELSTDHERKEIHLLGYFFDPDDAVLASALAGMREERSRRVERMVAQLNERGIGLRLEDVRAFAGGGSIGRPHVADALVSGGFVDSYDTAWRSYLRPGGAAYVERKKLPLAEAIALISAAGGVSSMAHPILNLPIGGIDRLLAQGTRPSALETTHPKIGEADAAALRGLCARYGLSESGGSDCHGSRRGTPSMGTSSIPVERLEALRTLARPRPA